MARFRVEFLGCKISYADAQAIRERLVADGHVEAAGEVDVAVVNTCCVTHEAVRKSRKALRRAVRGASRVYATGCAANLDGALTGMAPTVSVVPLHAELTPGFVADAVGRIGCLQDERGRERVRAFVKIQDGCSFRCSFCVIPDVRGTSRSRAAEAVVREARARVREGYREVVLAGINLGCYRDRESGCDLAELIRWVAGVPGLERLRLSSIEVNHVTPLLLATMRETPTVSRHLHVPLQSGDDGVLRAMGRNYDLATYLRRLERAEGFNVTSDVIVGFPGEDERAFARTLAAVERAGITKVHVFPYSPRPGTHTGGTDSVPPAVKRERGARLREASRRACERHWRQKLGTEDVVLVDRQGRGYGDDYTPWLVDAPVGELVRTRASGVAVDGVVGVVLEREDEGRAA